MGWKAVPAGTSRAAHKQTTPEGYISISNVCLKGQPTRRQPRVSGAVIICE